MTKNISINIDQGLYKVLDNSFNGDEKALNQFIIDAIRRSLNTSDSLPEQKNDLENYLKNKSPGSRTYGVNGQGW
jgi:hypothetical protein